MWSPICDFITLEPKREDDIMKNTKVGNGVKEKYMDYEIKNIDKLEDLKGHEWECKGKEFILSHKDSCTPALKLIMKNFIAPLSRKFTALYLADISKENLSELEFFGLKVILNEKPKLTRKERNFLECFHFEDSTIIKDSEGLTYIGDSEGGFDGINLLVIGMFNSLVRTHDKSVWTVAELMELEVED